jgi:tRNA(Ile2) C34 agmatinyltransferase TiaS
MAERFLVGLDDTDDLDSRGTGHRARQLGARLADRGFAVGTITRHQLLVDPRIPYTSHNSAACLVLSSGRDGKDLVHHCRRFLRDESAPGSDAGLCVARWGQIDDRLVAFGRRAKRDVLTMDDARMLADARRVHLEGVTGTGGGIIGALAAVGLRARGCDGRVLWLPQLRESQGVLTAAQVHERIGVDAVETEAGATVPPDDRVSLGEWPRPLMRAGRVVLLVEEIDHAEYDWIVVGKARLQQLSD